MAEVDGRMTVEAIQTVLHREKAEAETAHRKEKYDESRSYYSGQLDLIERLEAFIGA